MLSDLYGWVWRLEKDDGEERQVLKTVMFPYVFLELSLEMVVERTSSCLLPTGFTSQRDHFPAL